MCVFELLKKKSEKEKQNQARATQEKKRHKTTTTHIEYNTRYIYSWGNERNRREKPPRNRAAARRCVVVVLFLLQKERGGIPIPQLPNWGNFTIPLSECDGSNSLPRARFWCRFQHRRPKESDKTMMATPLFFLPNSLLAVSLTRRFS